MTALSALSPLDGRYARQTASLAPLFSELGLMRARLTAEVAWLLALSEEREVPELPPFGAASRARLEQVVVDFDEAAGQEIKTIEATTNHDVKAVEYYLRRYMSAYPDLKPAAEFVHFALTSEDINNVAYALMTQAGRDTILLPALDTIATALENLATSEAGQAMLARTHGQPASPTTLGKEIRVFVTRLKRIRTEIQAVPLLAKMNGAVGNYNAHYIAYPEVNWPEFSARVLATLGLQQNPHTTQIEPHDGLAELCHAFMRANTVLIDLTRDLWGYISLGYFRQKTRAGEVGSSTMPHKVNPIDFENAEGNLGLANALLDHLAAKLPISRFQRDLSDSTVLRNIGSAFGYALLAYNSCARGLGKLEVDSVRLGADLDGRVEVLTEAVQTVMRRYGQAGGYEDMKALSRGRALTAEDLAGFIAGLALPAAVKAQLLALTPATYTGNALAQAKNDPTT
ncbi:MAG TPA: adenylosuccinate lyase [Acidiferrobacter sp.]|nr:adenylosuccinate lyase [Acidiferrobacter sp.]